MLAIADNAHDDGDGAYPSIQTLARKTRLTGRNIQYLLRKLEGTGAISIRYKEGIDTVNIYKIIGMGGEKIAPPAPVDNPVDKSEGWCNPASKVVKPSVEGGETAVSPESLRTIKEPLEEGLPPVDKIKNGPWPEEDQWLRDWLVHPGSEIFPAAVRNLADPKWWEAVGISCGGVEEDFLTTEFAKMSAYLNENKEKTPKTQRGWKKFVRGWLERKHRWDQERASA